MTERSLPLDCSACLERLHAYLDGELESLSSAEVEAHLEVCAGCFDRSQLEEAFRRTIRAKAAPALEPPPGLAERIERALDRQEQEGAGRVGSGLLAGRGPSAGRWSSWTARALVAAAAVLVAAATWSSLSVPRVGGERRAESLHPAALRGELVCLDCLLAEMGTAPSGLDAHVKPPPVPSRNAAEHHRLHLRDREGRHWELLAGRETAPPLEIHENAGRTATVIGTAWPALRVVAVARLELE